MYEITSFWFLAVDDDGCIPEVTKQQQVVLSQHTKRTNRFDNENH